MIEVERNYVHCEKAYMTRLIVDCHGEDIFLTCEASGEQRITKDQEQAKRWFNNWLVGGVF
jgi:hypothetical protein